MSGYLELSDGALIGVRNGAVLGRVAGCDVVLEDGKASRKHARLIVEAGVVEIEDLQSSNGTLLNGKPILRRMLRDGDRIQIGKTVIVYRAGELPGRSRASSAGGTAPPERAPTAAPPTAARVVEFEDEVVEIQQPESPRSSAPGDDVVASSQRVLQFSKRPGGSNPLGDDLGQMPGGLRALLVLLVLAAGAGIVYGIFTAMQ
ncbi:MAG TPA: FHA domain-containing protein [bacterium]|nr:FHA domain-containing protein [bacterium]